MQHTILNFHDKPFNRGMLEEVIECINKTNMGHIKIYMCSEGGELYVMQALLDLIEEYHGSGIKIELIGYGELDSSAFELFVRANCSKRLLPHTMGMFHLGTISVVRNDAGKSAYASGKAIDRRAEEYYMPEIMAFMKDCEFTEAEIKSILAGDDVYFMHNRFQDIIEAYDRNIKCVELPN